MGFRNPRMRNPPSATWNDAFYHTSYGGHLDFSNEPTGNPNHRENLFFRHKANVRENDAKRSDALEYPRRFQGGYEARHTHFHRRSRFFRPAHSGVERRHQAIHVRDPLADEIHQRECQ
jgi:hypothetical protein